MTIPGYDFYRDQVPGIDRTIGAGGDTPHQAIRGYTAKHYKRLYKSPREIALILDKTLRAGYGVLEIGTVLAIDENNNNQLVPYTPDSISTTDVSRVFLLNDCDTADNFYVDMRESYKLAVGDNIVLTDSDGAYETEEIDAIDRTSSDVKAKITLTAATAGTFEISKDANCYIEASDDGDSNKCSTAAYILDMEVDTGAGARAEGGLGSVLVPAGNAIIYKDALPNIDSTAETSLGLTEDGAYYLVT